MVDLVRPGLCVDRAPPSADGYDFSAIAGRRVHPVPAAAETREAIEEAERDPNRTHDWRKVIELTRLAMGRLPGFEDWQPDRWVSRPLADGDVETWWEAITEREFGVTWLIQLANAWVGAIHQVQGGQLNTAETFETVREFFHFHQHPLWPQEWDLEFLRRRIGIK